MPRFAIFSLLLVLWGSKGDAFCLFTPPRALRLRQMTAPTISCSNIKMIKRSETSTSVAVAEAVPSGDAVLSLSHNSETLSFNLNLNYTIGDIDFKKTDTTPGKNISYYGRKILNGALVAPAMLTAPLYGIGFGLFGYKHTWAFSERIYRLSKPSEGHLHLHFRRMQRYMTQQKKQAVAKSWGYRVHPTFAGLSLITTALLAFKQGMFTTSGGNLLTSYEGFRALNIFVCFVSVIAAKPLEITMFGNSSAKRWNGIQGNLSMLFVALTTCPGPLGRLMAHFNWSILFCGGFLERVYVLCVLSQLGASQKKKYIELYSPQIKIATLASIPLGVLTFLVFN